MRLLLILFVAVSAVAQHPKPRAGPGGSTAKWGGITGNLPDQTDLNTALGQKQNTLAIGTAAQYYRGDQTLAAFPKVPTTYIDIVSMFSMKGVCTGFLKSDGSCAATTGGIAWGQITGDINTQLDLQTALSNRAPAFSRSVLNSGTTYQLTSADNGTTLVFNNAGSVTVTVPGNLQEGFSCLVLQLGGAVTIVGSNAAVHQRQNLTKTAGMYAVVSIVGYAPNTYVLSGDMQ